MTPDLAILLWFTISLAIALILGPAFKWGGE